MKEYGRHEVSNISVFVFVSMSLFFLLVFLTSISQYFKRNFLLYRAIAGSIPALIDFSSNAQKMKKSLMENFIFCAEQVSLFVNFLSRYCMPPHLIQSLTRQLFHLLSKPYSFDVLNCLHYRKYLINIVESGNIELNITASA